VSKVINYRLGVAFTVVQHFVSMPGTLGKQTGQEFICVAFDVAVKAGRIRQEDADAARKVIRDRLWPHNTVNGWAKEEGHFMRSGVPFVEEFDVMQEFRHRWLKELEREFFSKSD
jgi:hypothetical protein